MLVVVVGREVGKGLAHHGHRSLVGNDVPKAICCQHHDVRVRELCRLYVKHPHLWRDTEVSGGKECVVVSEMKWTLVR